MGIREWFVDLLSRGEAPEPNPDEIVDVEQTTVANAPIAVAALQDAGIAATSVDAFDPVSAVTRATIRVRRADVAAATEVLEGLR